MHHGMLAPAQVYLWGTALHLSHTKQTSCFWGHSCTGWRSLDEDRWNPALISTKCLFLLQGFSVSSFCPQHRQSLSLHLYAGSIISAVPARISAFIQLSHYLINDQLQSRFEPAEDNAGINRPQPESGYSFYDEISPFIFKISRTLLFTLTIYFIEKIW